MKTDSAKKPLRLVKRKVAEARKIGFIRALQIGSDRCVLKILEKIYHFHPSHSQAPTSAKLYRYIVADIVNQLEPTTVVEVECGLGEILALIRAEYRYGYDPARGVIRAACCLHGKTLCCRQLFGSRSEYRGCPSSTTLPSWARIVSAYYQEVLRMEDEALFFSRYVHDR